MRSKKLQPREIHLFVTESAKSVGIESEFKGIKRRLIYDRQAQQEFPFHYNG